MSSLRLLVAILPAFLLPMWVTAAEPSGAAGFESLRPFVKEWWVFLEGSGVAGMEPGIRGWKLKKRVVKESELDGVEAMLLPALAEDLKADEAFAQPSDSYRQYATGQSKQYHLLFIREFHRSHSRIWVAMRIAGSTRQ